MMKQTKQLWLGRFRHLLTTFLVGVAFWNSYAHTVAWFEGHGQEQAAWLAILPEMGTVLVIISLALGGLTVAQKGILGVVGLGSVSVTLVANLAGAAPGPGGTAAALVAPLFAIAGFALELTGGAGGEGVSHREPQVAHLTGSLRPTGSLTYEVIRLETPDEPVSQDGEPMSRADGLMWIEMAETRPTCAEVMAHCRISKATANRWLGAVPVR